MKGEALMVDHRACERCPNTFVVLDGDGTLCPRCRVEEWEDACRRVYALFPTTTKLEATPANLVGFMVGIQHRLAQAEK